ncbi:MAG: hypothetical protein RI967_440 [Planctomycetota bacterium]
MGRRYLWTDAHAVFALVGLHLAGFPPQGAAPEILAFEGLRPERAPSAPPGAGALDLAVALARSVHEVLGRFAPDDPRSGWISGLSDRDGARTPCVAGLRIGKPRLERAVAPDRTSAGGGTGGGTQVDPIDDPAEWERDGQYFHYLVKWMHALDRLARATGDVAWCANGAALARVACERFLLSDGRGPRLAWKMSVDLSRPVVDSSGLHDALGGLVACLALRDSMEGLARRSGRTIPGNWFEPEIALLSEICAREGSWRTADPLGAGELALDLATLDRLAAGGCADAQAWRARVADACASSLRAVPLDAILAWPPSRRLAFRELGFALGVGALADAGRTDGLAPRAVEAAARIVADWSDPAARTGPAWRAHEDIGDATLAACLAPAAIVPRSLADAAAPALSPPSARDRPRGCTGG